MHLTRSIPVVVVLASSIFAARPAYADQETVHLTNGSVFSGELVEKIPGDHVTIKLATGEIRKIEWSDIAPQNAVAAPTGALPQVVVAPSVPTPPPRPAHVRFESDAKGALLMRVDNIAGTAGIAPYATETETPVCYAPCAADVDANARYYVRGAYISRSARFAIRDGESALAVRSGSSGVSTAGAWLLSIGILSTITGAIATPIAYADAKGPGLNGWQDFGIASLVGGGAFILLSIPFIVAGRTHVAMGDMDVAHHTRWMPGGFRF